MAPSHSRRLTTRRPCAGAGGIGLNAARPAACPMSSADDAERSGVAGRLRPWWPIPALVLLASAASSADGMADRWSGLSVLSLVGAGALGAGLAWLAISYRRRWLQAQRERQRLNDVFQREAQALARIGHWGRWFDGRTAVWSELIFAIHGRDPAAGVPVTLEAYLDYVVPEDRERVRGIYRQVARTGDHVEYQYAIRRGDGTVRHVRVFAQGERGPDGSVVGIFGAAQDVTEQEQMLRTLQENEVRLQRSEASERGQATLLRTAIEAMPFAVWSLRRDGSYGIQNQVATDWWGRLTDGRPEDRAPGAATLAIWQENNARAWAGETVDRESAIQTSAGERIIRDIVVPIRLDGAVDGLLGISLDLTSQRSTERQARQAEARFAAAFRVAPDAIVISRLADGLIVDVNDGFERISGWPRELAIGRTVIELGLFPDPAERRVLRERLLQGGGVLTGVDLTLIMRNGDRRDLLIAYRVLEPDGGEPLLLSISHDITELRRATDELGRAHRFTRAILDATNAMILVLDRSGSVISINAGAERLLGWASAEVVGRTWEMFVPPEERPGIAAALQRTIASGASAVHENAVLTRAGSRIWVSWVTTVMPGSAPGEVERIIATGIDTTAQRHSMTIAMAAERDAVVGRLAGKVAHEVNNPLEAIKALVEPLRRRSEGLPKVAEGLAVIDRQVDRIARLVRSLLGLVRQRSSHQTRVPLGEICTMVVELFEPRFAKSGKRLSASIPADLPMGFVDADQVQQVVINLLENALAACAPGGCTTLAVSGGDEWLELVVEDDGPGLGSDPERLFEPFVTTKANGSGLGLAVARQICTAHGGWIQGENRAPHGARFTVRLRTDQRRPPEDPGAAANDGEIMA